MARPIRNTPILMGDDAENFLREINILPSDEEREKERTRVEANAQQFVSLVLNIKRGRVLVIFAKFSRAYMNRMIAPLNMPII